MSRLEQIFVDQAIGLYCNIKHDLIKALTMFKGTWTRFELKISNFIFPFLMFIMINIEVHNATSKLVKYQVISKIQSS